MVAGRRICSGRGHYRGRSTIAVVQDEDGMLKVLIAEDDLLIAWRCCARAIGVLRPCYSSSDQKNSFRFGRLRRKLAAIEMAGKALHLWRLKSRVR
jgi:hypothetical protein